MKKKKKKKGEKRGDFLIFFFIFLREKRKWKYKKTYLQGMLGLDDQSHMISDAVNSPWTSSGLTKWLI